MSLAACIPELVASGRIRKADAEAASRAYNRHYARLAEEMGPEAAAAEASERAVAEAEYMAELRDRQTRLQIRAQQKLDADMAAEISRGTRPHRALTGLLREVETATQRIEAQAHERIHGFIDRHRRNLIGQPKDKTGLLDFVNERHGNGTGNATARQLSDAVGEAFEWLRLRFNRNGGDIRYRADYGMTHRHDPLRVRQAGYAQWRQDILDEIDVGRMVDPLSGQAFTPDRLEEFLSASFANISTNGLAGPGSSAAAAGGPNARKLANRRSDPRHFIFRDGAAWLRYAEKYGEGNPFEAVIAHIHGMARDIAFMERFGPNPAASWRRAIDVADRADAQGPGAAPGSVKGTSAGRRHAEKMWRYMNGDLTVPVLPDGPVAGPIARHALNGIHAIRDLLTAAFLGSAQITAITDVNTQIFARRMNALPATGVVMGYARMLNPLSAKDRKRAKYLLGGTRDATRAMLSIARFYGESHSPRWSQVLADGVLRVTGLNKFFEAGQRLFIDDYARQLAGERSLRFAELPEARRAAFEKYRIDAADWDVIRAAETFRQDGDEWVDWHKVAEADPGAADKMLDLMLREARSAVIEADAETQATIRFDRPGTFAGEVGANIVQFKSFPVALVMDQARRISEIAERHGAAAAGRYAASFFLGMTLFGALSLQLKEVLKGKDMRPMDSGDFWLDAALQGGGIGVFGDVIGAVTKDRVDGLLQLAGGPMVQAGQDVVELTKSLIPDEEGTDNPGRQATRFARRYTPGTSIWWARAAIDRWIWDEMAEQLDPEYADSWDRLEASAEDQGQGYYWRPGEDMPDRPPELGENVP